MTFKVLATVFEYFGYIMITEIYQPYVFSYTTKEKWQIISVYKFEAAI